MYCKTNKISFQTCLNVFSSQKKICLSYIDNMEVEKIIEAPYITIKRNTQKGIKRIEARPDVTVLDKSADETFTKYGVYCGSSAVGYVSVIDKDDGIWVDYIKNYAPKKYSGFGKIADQIEVEHCLNRGLDEFEILSDATPSSLVYHYKRGKRFDYIEDESVKINLKNQYGTYNINKILGRLIMTNRLPFIKELEDCVPMYMPQSLIKKYIDIIKKYPLLKL